MLSLQPRLRARPRGRQCLPSLPPRRPSTGTARCPASATSGTATTCHRRREQLLQHTGRTMILVQSVLLDGEFDSQILQSWLNLAPLWLILILVFHCVYFAKFDSHRPRTVWLIWRNFCPVLPIWIFWIWQHWVQCSPCFVYKKQCETETRQTFLQTEVGLVLKVDAKCSSVQDLIRNGDRQLLILFHHLLWRLSHLYPPSLARYDAYFSLRQSNWGCFVTLKPVQGQ